MAKWGPLFSTLLVILGILSHLTPSLGLGPWPASIAPRIRVDADAIGAASVDFGKEIHPSNPAAVLYPCSVQDIATLIKFSYNLSTPFSIAARGRGHSLQGQAMAPNGVVVEMTSLNNCSGGSRITVTKTPPPGSGLGSFVDVGGEQLWIDVLQATLKEGLAPVSWTDYLYLTVAGTLSNAGISGETFRRGPQINNVYELDVITGRGEIVTCSKDKNPQLFFAVLGGLGQFGIITRARIPIEPAPKKAKWIQLLYNDFTAFSRDQELLISIVNGIDYVEGSILLQNSPASNWQSSFPPADHSRISSIISQYGIIYCLEAVIYFNDPISHPFDEELQEAAKEFQFIPGFDFAKNVSFLDFLNRVRGAELALQAQGLWDIPHPWLSLFVPESQMLDFSSGVFKNILPKLTQTVGPFLVYPMNANKWDGRTSAVIPDGTNVFYTVGLLHSGRGDEWKAYENQNKEVLQFLDKAGIKYKTYLHAYKTKEEWRNHFGPKWKNFEDMKFQYDPKMILSPGQQIFNSI